MTQQRPTRMNLGVACFLMLAIFTGSAEASAVVASPRRNLQQSSVSTLTPNFDLQRQDDHGDFDTKVEEDTPLSLTIMASSTTTTVTAPTETAAPPPPTPKRNPVVGLVVYVKDTLTQTISGCGTLWSNYGRCQEIRAKIKAHKVQRTEQLIGDENTNDYATKKKQIQKQLDALPPGGISYAEYAFLQKNKDDRGKVLNLLFISFGAPRFLPYMLIFNSDMLPAPLQPQRKAHAETLWEQVSRERRTQIVTTLLNIDKEARQAAAGLAKVFGSAKHDAQQQKAQVFANQVVQVLEEDLTTTTTMTATESTSTVMTTPSYQGAESLLQRLRPYLIKTKGAASSTINNKKKKKNDNPDDFSREDKRLSQVPPCVIKGLVNAVSGQQGSWFSNLTPNFMLRGKLLGHIQKVQDADAFLAHNQMSLASISTPLLQQACSDRMIGGPRGSSRAELQQSLQDWLTLVGNWTNAAPGTTTASPYVYNDNMVRGALLTYYGLHGVKDARQSTLPRSLFAPSDNAQSVSALAENAQKQSSKRKQKKKNT